MRSNLTSRSLVLALVDGAGTFRAADAYDVGAALGYTVHQIRLVLSRLVDEGLLTSVGRGREAVFSTTDRHEHLHGPEPEWLAMAFRQDDGAAPWDGTWRMVSFTLGEDRKAQRSEVRETITGMGAALLMPGVYVHAVDWTQWLDAAITRIGVRDAVVVAEVSRWTVHGHTDPRAIAAHLWPLDDVAAGYRRLLERHGTSSGRTDVDPLAALVESIEVVAAFEQCIREDPLLPPELLPPDWPGRDARDLIVATAQRLRAARSDAGLPQLFARYDAAIGDRSSRAGSAGRARSRRR